MHQNRAYPQYKHIDERDNRPENTGNNSHHIPASVARQIGGRGSRRRLERAPVARYGASVTDPAGARGPGRRLPRRQTGHRPPGELPAGRFLAPGVLLYSVVFALPMLGSIPLALTDWNGVTSTTYVGLSNFERVIGSQSFWLALEHNAIIAVSFLVLANVVGFALALLLERRPAGYRFYRTVIFMPAVLSFLATGFIWSVLLDPEIGVVNPLLGRIGLSSLEHDWLASPRLALAMVILIGWWQWGGVPMVIYGAGLRSIPDELLDMAEIDGVHGIARLRFVLLPLLRPAVLVTAVITLVTAFQTFAVVYVLEGPEGAPEGRTDVIATLMYRSFFDFGFAEANAAVVMVLLGVGLLVLQRLLLRRSGDS